MNNSDEAVDKVLQGLRNAEAPTGMDQRILKRIDGHAAMLEERGRPARPWSKQAFALCGIAAVVVVWLTSALTFGRDPTVDRFPIDKGTLTRSASLHAQDARNDRASSHPKPARTSVRHLEPHLAVSVTKVASFPAPPMPLTEQERLLLSIVHKGDPEQVAMLHPRILDPQTAKEKTDFQEFFDETPKGDHQ